MFGASPATAYETGVGEVRDVTLADGTTIALSADTRIEVRLTSDERRARVDRGEALFDIAGGSSGAFSVVTRSGGVETESGQVLVKVLPQGTRISLLSGAGRAWPGERMSSSAPVTLAAQSEFEVGRREIDVARLETPLIERRTLWRTGRLAFDDAPLAEAVADVSRHTGVRFTFADPALGDLRVSGLIDARDLESFLLMLRRNVGLNAERARDGDIRLSLTAPPAP